LHPLDNQTFSRRTLKNGAYFGKSFWVAPADLAKLVLPTPPPDPMTANPPPNPRGQQPATTKSAAPTVVLPPEASADVIKALKAAKARAGTEPSSIRKQVLQREKSRRLEAVAAKYKVTPRQLADYIEAQGLDKP
jgi:hypothetical protein